MLPKKAHQLTSNRAKFLTQTAPQLSTFLISSTKVGDTQHGLSPLLFSFSQKYLELWCLPQTNISLLSCHLLCVSGFINSALHLMQYMGESVVFLSIQEMMTRILPIKYSQSQYLQTVTLLSTVKKALVLALEHLTAMSDCCIIESQRRNFSSNFNHHGFVVIITLCSVPVGNMWWMTTTFSGYWPSCNFSYILEYTNQHNYLIPIRKGIAQNVCITQLLLVLMYKANYVKIEKYEII